MLPAEDHRRVKRRAAELGVSFAEYVRRAIARELGDEQRGTDVTALFALGESGATDISANADAHLAEALTARRRRGGR